jgi:hypothetical protein
LKLKIFSILAVILLALPPVMASPLGLLAGPTLWQIGAGIVVLILAILGGVFVLLILGLLLVGYNFRELLRKDVILAFFYVATVITALTPFDGTIGEIVFGSITLLRGIYVYAKENGRLPGSIAGKAKAIP